MIEQPRAKHVRLKLCHFGGLDVVVPKGFDSRKIPAVVAARQTWLRRARARQREQLRSLPDEYFERQPARVRLPALNETYTVLYKSTAGARVMYAEQGNTLEFAGPVDDLDACAHGLRTWLRARARQALPPWLRQTSLALGLPYQKTVIRGQRTRWGSCSVRGVISLNCKLLFLNRPEVEYLLIHELCHTRHLNHSTRYWALVERKLPDYRRFEAALRDAWRSIPRWGEE